jgi:AcrR family transcriptional regulator
VGRPARLDREMIARAAHEVGLEHLTMKAVADRLGVSVAGLYHHIAGRDDLVGLAAEHAAAQIRVPVDHGQHWTEWLLEWSRYAYDAFVAQPDLLNQFRSGLLGVDRMVVHLDAAIGLLVRQGFSTTDARDAYGLVSACAVGAAFGRIRESESERSGHPLAVEYHRVLAARGGQLPHLRALIDSPSDARTLEDQIRTVLVGIAVQRGEPWQGIVAPPPDAADARVVPLHP